MIRPATPDDIPVLVEMGREFHGAAGWGDITSFDDDDCAQTIANMIAVTEAIVMVAENAEGKIIGMAGGVTSPIYFNYAHKTGQELFFWMRPDARQGDGAKLLVALEEEARALGCKSWVMIALDKIRPDATGALYKRRGYRLAEHNWIKRL